jgi:hypothetical protein
LSAGIFSVSASAQLAYSFQKDSLAYNELPAAKTIQKSAWADPFTFSIYQLFPQFFGQNSDPQSGTIVNDMGQMQYQEYLGSDNYILSALGVNTITAFSGNGEVSYYLAGPPGNDTLMLQYKDVTFSGDPSYNNDYFNFQIWLYKATNVIEYRYGPGNVPVPYTGHLAIGVYDLQGLTGVNSVSLSGNPASPSVGQGDVTLGGITGVPSPNTVYRFTPAPTAVNNVSSVESKTTAIYIKSNATIELTCNTEKINSYQLYNMSGQVIAKAQNTKREKVAISTANLVPGVYLLNAKTQTNSTTHKIFIY